MILPQHAMRGFSKLTIIYVSLSFGKVCGPTFRNMWKNAALVNDKSFKQSLLQVFFNPFMFQSEISMDFITSLPTSEGKDVIFVIVDRITKYAHFVGISLKSKATQVIDSYFKSIFKIHGFPKVIVSERDPKFTRNF
jgi:hypothetical protein